MAWQGVPFPYLGSLGLLIEKIPHLDVTTSSGFGWDTVVASVAGAIVASSIPAGIAWWSIKKNTETMLSDRAAQIEDYEKSREIQVKIAEQARIAQTVSSNRLVWIKDLREASAEFVSTVYENMILSQRVVYELRYNNQVNLISQNKIDLNESFQKFVLQMTRIRMMLNPGKVEHQRVVVIMNELKTYSEKMIKTLSEIDADKINAHLNDFIYEMQLLLKEDWEKVKKSM